MSFPITRFCDRARTSGPSARRGTRLRGGVLASETQLVERQQERAQGAIGDQRVPRLLADTGPAHPDMRQAREQVHPNVLRILQIVPDGVCVQE